MAKSISQNKPGGNKPGNQKANSSLTNGEGSAFGNLNLDNPEVITKDPIIEDDENLTPDEDENPKQDENKASAEDILSGTVKSAKVTTSKEFSIPKQIILLRKIENRSFRLGMEKSDERPNLVPGTAHTFVPYKQGNKYLNMFDKPLFAGMRPYIEQRLGINLSDTSSYYEDLTFKMFDRRDGQVITLDDTNMGLYHMIVYSCMLAAPIIANGLQEYTNGTKPFAEWYIENREAQAAAESEQIELEMKVYEQFQKLTTSKIISLGKILNLDVWGVSPEVAKTTLWKFVKNGNRDVPQAAAMKLFANALSYDDTKVNVMSLVKDAIKFHVLRQDKTKEYFFGDLALGMSVDEITTRLMNVKYNNTRLSIEQRVNLKLATI